MPKIDVIFFQDEGSVPVLDFLRQLVRSEKRVAAKCQESIERLAEMGHELRRPEADFLRDGIYELRIRWSSVNYRILYFYHGRTAAVLAHGITKENAVPHKAIELAIQRKQKYLADPKKHTYVHIPEQAHETSDDERG